MTALEVLIPNSSSNGKRGAVVALVKKAADLAGDSDAKAVGKRVDDLYKKRNQLMHEAKPISEEEFNQLKTIVQRTLISLLEHD